MQDSAIVYASDLIDKLLAMKKTQKTPKKGTSTGFFCLDELILLSKTYLMLTTGVPSSGKSEVMDAIAVNTSIASDWKWAIFSPENFPIEEHVKKLIEKYVGKAFWEMTVGELRDGTLWVNDHFIWLYPPEEKLTPRDLLNYLATIMETVKIDAYILDPWNEMTHDTNMRDDQYISKQLTDIRRFNRAHNLLGCIVIHPRGLQKDKDGNTPVPTLSDCHGGSMWRNKADIGICVHRHDMSKHEATVYVQKVKYKWMGKVGLVDLDYDPASGRFKSKEAPDFTLPGQELPYL
jgi:twinkle protein